MIRWLYAALAAVAIACLPQAARADGGSPTYRFVVACDASFGPLTSSGPSTLTYDQHGQACGAGGGGGGGGGAITAAAGSYAVGAFSVGSGSDGWDVAQGATANTACGTDAGTGCTMLQRLARIATNLTTLNTTAGGPVNNLASSNADPCFGSLKSNFAISTTAGTTQLVAGVSAKKIYVCSMKIIAGGTAAVSLIEGTNATCASPAAVSGSTTAASGMALIANAGWTEGAGVGTVEQTATNANYLCLLQSSTVQLSGNITYVQQ
jgi:hypothetical protein